MDVIEDALPPYGIDHAEYDRKGIDLRIPWSEKEVLVTGKFVRDWNARHAGARLTQQKKPAYMLRYIIDT